MKKPEPRKPETQSKSLSADAYKTTGSRTDLVGMRQTAPGQWQAVRVVLFDGEIVDEVLIGAPSDRSAALEEVKVAMMNTIGFTDWLIQQGVIE